MKMLPTLMLIPQSSLTEMAKETDVVNVRQEQSDTTMITALVEEVISDVGEMLHTPACL
jgi:hypothetical protein